VSGMPGAWISLDLLFGDGAVQCGLDRSVTQFTNFAPMRRFKADHLPAADWLKHQSILYVYHRRYWVCLLLSVD
jgi:hypothetical protein